MIKYLAAIFVLAFVFTVSAPMVAADCLYGEWSNGGCKPAPGATPTPQPSGTTIPPFTSTPRPAILSATNRCDPASHYNVIVLTIRYAGPTELWSEGEWAPRKEAAGTGTGNRTVTFSWNASFNKVDFSLMPQGSRGPVYDDHIAGVTVHAIWGPAAPGC